MSSRQFRRARRSRRIGFFPRRRPAKSAKSYFPRNRSRAPHRYAPDCRVRLFRARTPTKSIRSSTRVSPCDFAPRSSDIIIPVRRAISLPDAMRSDELALRRKKNEQINTTRAPSAPVRDGHGKTLASKKYFIRDGVRYRVS